MARSRLREKSSNLLWKRFSAERTPRSARTASWLANNFVNATHTGSLTHYELVEAICASADRAIPIVKLSEELRATFLPRGKTILGPAGDLLDSIATNHSGMEWWLTESGLYMDLVTRTSAVALLPPFEAFAGSRVSECWEAENKHTKLSKEAFLRIADELGAHGFKLSAVLQPASRDAIAFVNRKNPRAKIKTFKAAAVNPRFSRILRRRLYRAREMYAKALNTAHEPPAQPIPKIFSSHPIY